MDQPLNTLPILATDAEGIVQMTQSPVTGWKLTLTDPSSPRPQIVIVEGPWDNAQSFLTDAGFTYDQNGPEPLEVRLRTTHQRAVEGGVEVATGTPVSVGDQL
ncbi:MAG: hypothetical protein K2X93_05355 [Candidatus Obscuribacterales bacterium]|nr:hypothetical protein [Candidatus Obscuribacterales bacterium]